MTKTKKAAVTAALLLTMAMAVLGCEARVESPPSPPAESEVAEEEAALAEEKARIEEEKRLEEERIKEENRLQAEEEKRKLEEEKQQTWEEERRIYVKAKSTHLYAGPSMEAEKVGDLSYVEEGFRQGRIADAASGTFFYGWKDRYEGDLLGYVQADQVVSKKEDLIYRLYEGVDYGPFEKLGDRENNPPVKVRGIFMTAHSASTKRFDELLKIIDETQINAVVIDVKDDNDNVLFDSETTKKYNPAGNKRFIKDMESFMKELDDRGIYTIARVVVFKSPKYALAHPDRAIIHRASGKPFSNRDGSIWASPFDRDLWDYNVGVAREAVAHGFDEIQFDYVRFPASAENRLDASLDYRNENLESKTAAIQGFLKFAYGELAPMGAYVSADVFGWTATAVTDVGIGQQWEAITSVVDYICPMIYPSHYGPGIFGFDVPDAHPYGTVYASVMDGIERNKNAYTPAVIRPWIQDFTAPWVKGYIRYGYDEILAQVRALEDAGIDEYIFWNAGNRYTTSAFNELMQEEE